jgi:Protein of unknown function (DUF4242)
MQTFLVEHYRPGLSAEDLRHAAGVIRAAARALEGEGSTVHYVASTIVPADEAFMSVFEAESEEDVRAAYARAGAEFERISAAVAAD